MPVRFHSFWFSAFPYHPCPSLFRVWSLTDHHTTTRVQGTGLNAPFRHQPAQDELADKLAMGTRSAPPCATLSVASRLPPTPLEHSAMPRNGVGKIRGGGPPKRENFGPPLRDPRAGHPCPHGVVLPWVALAGLLLCLALLAGNGKLTLHLEAMISTSGLTAGRSHVLQGCAAGELLLSPTLGSGGLLRAGRGREGCHTPIPTGFGWSPSLLS